MALDPLAISSGSNRGEAAFLGESSFDPVQFAYRAAQDMKIQRERDRKDQVENLVLLDDKIKTQWDADTFNYFQPKLAAYKESVMEAFKANNGKLNPLQKMEFKNQLDSLSAEADVNNALWKDYQDQVQLLDKDTEGKFDRAASAQLLNIWRNPYQNPEAKADIQQNYGGNINKWRAANAERFRILPSFSMDQYIGDITKDEKAATFAVKDEKGNVIYGKHPTGERFYEEETRLTPQQLNTVNNRIWAESNYKADKAKARARQEVDKIFSISDTGHIGFSSELGDKDKAAAKYIVAQAGDLRGLKPEEVKERLAKGYTALQIDAKTNQGKKLRDIGFAPQSSGSAESKKPQVDFTPQDLGDQDVAANIIVGPGQKRAVQISTPNEGDNKPLQLNSDTGFIIKDGKKQLVKLTGKPIVGKVVRTISGEDVDGKKVVFAEVDAQALTNKELNPEQYKYSFGTAKDDRNDKPVTKYYIPLRTIAKNLHSEFKKYNKTNTIGKLNELHGIDYSDLSDDKAPAAGKTSSAAPKAGKSVSTSKIKSLVGQPGYEGYTEKELIEYYKSQGYTIK